MSWPVMIAGFTLGAAGSLHCVGMCGPLSLALPVYRFSKTRKIYALLLYQFGRIITYSVMGLLFGVAGRRIYISGYQQWFSIGLGVLILLFAALYFFRRWSSRPVLLNGFYKWVQSVIAGILKSATTTISFFFLGMANGLLPCGMVYIAIASTLSLYSVSESVSFMAMFGTGTVPAMMLVGYAGQLFTPAWRNSFRKMVPVFISLMGALLILRGLNLGVPFISPELPQSPGSALICHP